MIPRNCYQVLNSTLHFVNNDNICADDKLAKIHPLINKIHDECAKKSTSTCQSLLKLLLSCMLSCLVMSNKVFFGSRFSSYDLLLCLKTKGILCVRIISVNRLQGCPLESSKTLSKAGRGTVDYRCDKNSRRFVIEWVDNSVVQLASDFVGIEVLESIVHWCRKDKTRKEIPCPQIILEYNKSMRRVDLVNMFLALYCTPCKMNKWYQKIFWNLTDIAKVNSWLLYCHHFVQYDLPEKDMKSFLTLSLEIGMH